MSALSRKYWELRRVQGLSHSRAIGEISRYSGQRRQVVVARLWRITGKYIVRERRQSADRGPMQTQSRR